MKVALVNGSPRGTKSSSLNILKGLKTYLQEDISIEIEDFMWNLPNSGLKDFEKILSCDAIVFSFPLYIDSIPSNLLQNLVNFEEYIKNNKPLFSKEINVYVTINNGFFDGKQNCLAIENIEYFCDHVGFKYKQGLGIGGGGMLPSIENVPYGHGPKKSIGNELKKLADNIKLSKGSTTTFIEPNFPGFIYKIMAQTGWRKAIKRNGLRKKDIGRRIT